MLTIADLVERDSNFLAVKGRRRLNDREAALLNAAYVVAESQLSKYKVRVEKRSGDQRVEQERARIAVIRAQAMVQVERIGKWLNTPYIEYFPDGNSVTETEVGKNENEVVSRKLLPARAEPARNDSEVAKALPGWAKPVVLFIEQTFARMTPLTTALWFLIVVVAFIALGWAQKSYLESSFDYIAKENTRLQSENLDLRTKLDNTDLAIAQSAQDSRIISGLQAESDRLKGQLQAAIEKEKQVRDESQAKLIELQQQQAETILKFQENADAATRSQIEALSEAKLRLQSDLASKEAVISDLNSRNETISREGSDDKALIAQHERTISDLNSSVAQQQTQLRTLQSLRSQKNALVAFTNSILELVNEVLYEARYSRVNPYERREDFTSGFLKLRNASKSTLDDLGIRASM